MADTRPGATAIYKASRLQLYVALRRSSATFGSAGHGRGAATFRLYVAIISQRFLMKAMECQALIAVRGSPGGSGAGTDGGRRGHSTGFLGCADPPIGSFALL